MQSLFLFLLFIFTTLSHACFLIFAHRHPQMSEQTRRKFWLAHLWGNGIVWAVLFVWMIVMQFTFPHTLVVSNFAKLTGFIFFIVGVSIVIKIALVLNFEHLMGLRFFYPAKAKRVYSSLYHVFRNPMYDGFVLMLIGVALFLGIKEDLYLALASFLLLNIVLATVENYEFSWNPF
ncbi:MAG: hypothetical protein HYS51_01770 [Candidatus Zambryskibacteria bacterium]|nr:hypothetical protein [Candidatus Zambryskibacteria bacterium]